MPDNVAETFFLKDDAEKLRGVYQGKVPEPQASSNIRRLSEPGALTSVLNWYRALDPNCRVGNIYVSTLHVWGDQDLAAGRAAAMATARYVNAPYQFEILDGYSHWLLEEAPDRISTMVLKHLKANPVR